MRVTFRSTASRLIPVPAISALLLAAGIPITSNAEDIELWLSSSEAPADMSIVSFSPPDREGQTAVQEEQPRGGGALISQRIAGSALRPRRSGVDFNPSGSGGCIYASNSAGDIFNTPIWLPQGTTVDTLRMYYYDTSASNSTAWFTVYDLYGSIVDEWAVSSSGDFGNSFSDSSPIDHVVDYSIYSYLLNWRPNVAGTTMQLCGFRIFHSPPSPTIFWDRFEQN
jgi:hypothetical protein